MEGGREGRDGCLCSMRVAMFEAMPSDFRVKRRACPSSLAHNQIPRARTTPCCALYQPRRLQLAHTNDTPVNGLCTASVSPLLHTTPHTLLRIPPPLRLLLLLEDRTRHRAAALARQLLRNTLLYIWARQPPSLGLQRRAKLAPAAGGWASSWGRTGAQWSICRCCCCCCRCC